MSHKDYVKELYEESLENLIETAQARLKELRQSGYVPVWCVLEDDLIIRGRYSIDQHDKAVERLIEVAKAIAKDGGDVVVRVEKEKIRPHELDELLSHKYK